VRIGIVTIVILVGLVFSLTVLVSGNHGLRILGDQRGYAPEQPIAFSHRLHAGELGINCLYCHFGAEKSRHAGIPAAGICMNCHKFITAPLGAIRAEDELAKEEERKPEWVVSTEIRKIYDALALDGEMNRRPEQVPAPLEWVKVHNVPDFVYFDHRPHVSAGVSCQHCHGAVETMERVYQVGDLSMGWCVNCHRDANEIGVGGKPVNASIDCVTCHY